MLKPMVPRFLFCFVAERDFRKQAKANGVLERFRERPYAGGTAGDSNSVTSALGGRRTPSTSAVRGRRSPSTSAVYGRRAWS